MIFRLRYIGTYGDYPAKAIQLTVEGVNGTITEDLTDSMGNVNPDYIDALISIANQLENQNKQIRKLKIKNKNGNKRKN